MQEDDVCKKVKKQRRARTDKFGQEPTAAFRARPTWREHALPSFQLEVQGADAAARPTAGKRMESGLTCLLLMTCHLPRLGKVHRTVCAKAVVNINLNRRYQTEKDGICQVCTISDLYHLLLIFSQEIKID